MSDPKTIAEAMEEVTEESLAAEEEEQEETVEEEAEEESVDEESEEEQEEEESEEESDEEESEEEDSEWGVDEDEDSDFFDELSQEQLAEIKKHPELNALRKQLMKGYEKKTTQHANLVKLGEAYRKNPLGVLQAIADQMGLAVVRRGDTASTEDAAEKKPSRVEAAAMKLEKLFGEKAGPAVRETLKEFVDAVSEETIAPVQRKLSESDKEKEQTRYLREEADFRERHKKILTAELENEVVKLGESRKYVPGPGTTASEYLDTLLEVALAKRGQTLAKDANKNVAKKLRDKIDRNRRDREPRGTNSKSGVKKISRLQKEPASFRNLSEAIDAAAAELEDDLADF